METTIFKTIEKIIGIPFVESELDSGAVCFANDKDLRSDFRIQFTLNDVVNYVYGILSSLDSNTNSVSILDFEIPYPTNAASFWKYSNIGKQFRQQKIIEDIEFITVSELNWENI